MMDMLCTFYYPADNWQFKYDGNPLRKVMEYIFRAAYNYGLLPQECFERDNQLNLLESNRYMSGLVTKHSELRYGSDMIQYSQNLLEILHCRYSISPIPTRIQMKSIHIR